MPTAGAFGLDWLIQPNTTSGPVVNPQTALHVPTVKAAVELVATSIGNLPVKVYRREGDAKVLDTDHTAHKLVHRSANDYQSAAAFRTQLATDALLHGNGYGYAVRVNGTVRELVRLDPRSISATLDPSTGAPVYQSNETPRRTFAAADIIHIRGAISHDGLNGLSPVQLHREAIGLALTLELHAARLFGRGARPSGLLKFPGKLTAESIGRIKTSFGGAHGGDESGRTAVLEDGGEFVPLTFTSVDAQFIEQRNAAAYEIARAFGVPPSMVGLVDRATWGNAETQNRQFLTFTLRPWLNAFRSEFERVLLSEEERETHIIEAITDDLLRADTASRTASYQALRSAGIMTANEIRAFENLPPRADGDTLASPFTTSGDAPAPAPAPAVAA